MSSSHVETEVEKELREKCEAIDTTKSGIIAFADLKKAISSLGEDIGENDLKEMVEESKSGVDEESTQVRYLDLIKAMYADEPAGDEE